MKPSERACLSQYINKNYPGIDNWTDSPLHKGNIIYIWEADNQTEHGKDVFATTPKTAFQCDGDPKILKNSLQTDLNPKYNTHRGILRAYEINGDVDAAFSHCEANTCHGEGGGEQYYIPNFDEQLQNNIIRRREDLNINFDPDKLHIKEEDIEKDEIKTQAQIEEFPKQVSLETGQLLPSKGTTPTLDGAYNGKTEGLAEEIKPQVNRINEQNKDNSYNNDYYGGKDNDYNNDYYNGIGY